jgi:hypothetical protein
MELLPPKSLLSKRVTAALIVLALALLAGCGSGGGSDTPTKTAFIKEADAICKHADDEQTKALEGVVKSKGSLANMSIAEQQELAVEVGLPPVQQEAEELGDLTPPAGDESEVEAFVKSIEEGTKKAEANPALLNAGAGPLKKADEMGKSYGFGDCAEVS